MSFQKSTKRESAPAAPAEAVSDRVMELLTMLTYKRPAWSKAESAFIKRYILPLGASADVYGNYWLTVGEGSRIMWSSHTDTVHRASGTQKVTLGGGAITSDSNCLGADCTTGVWIMRQMILAKVPGTYVFHRAEEIGGLGSRHIASKETARLAGLDFAIAFDRKGYKEVITHQMGERTASDAFALSFAAAMPDLELEASDGGTFTDTANYIDHIGECANISIGQFQGHSPSEFQDVAFACRLADSLIAADFSKLVAARKPGDSEPSAWFREYPCEHHGATAAKSASSVFDCCRIADRATEDYVYNNPGKIADMLSEMGFSYSDLRSYRVGALSARQTLADESDEDSCTLPIAH